MINVDKLRGKMVEKRYSVDQMASDLKITKSTVYRKLKSGDFTIREATIITGVMSMSADEAMSIFFAQYVA